jgi:hypothetical protein
MTTVTPLDEHYYAKLIADAAIVMTAAPTSRKMEEAHKRLEEVKLQAEEAGCLESAEIKAMIRIAKYHNQQQEDFYV